MLRITVGERSFILSDEEERALLTQMLDIAEWLENFVRHRARVAMDEAIEEYTEYNPRKLTDEQKRQVVASLPLKTVAERQKELEEGPASAGGGLG